MRACRRIVLNIIISLVVAGSAFGADIVTFYHNDPTGSPIAITDANGNIVWEANYKPFGEEYSVTGMAENDRRFIGKEKDEETGLNYFGARYHKAEIGRFLSPDPVGPVDPRTGKINRKILLNPQRLNLYAYGLNNPYRYVDPDGREVRLVTRPLNLKGGSIGVHSFVEIKPNNPAAFRDEKRWVIGGYDKNGILVSGKNEPVDLNWSGSVKGSYVIPAPQGKTDTEFIKAIMNAFSHYKQGSRDYEAFPELSENEGNCHNVSTGALVGAGVPPYTLKKIDPAGFNPGLGTPLPEMIK